MMESFLIVSFVLVKEPSFFKNDSQPYTLTIRLDLKESKTEKIGIYTPCNLHTMVVILIDQKFRSGYFHAK